MGQGGQSRALRVKSLVFLETNPEERRKRKGECGSNSSRCYVLAKRFTTNSELRNDTGHGVNREHRCAEKFQSLPQDHTTKVGFLSLDQ